MPLYVSLFCRLIPHLSGPTGQTARGIQSWTRRRTLPSGRIPNPRIPLRGASLGAAPLCVRPQSQRRVHGQLPPRGTRTRASFPLPLPGAGGPRQARHSAPGRQNQGLGKKSGPKAPGAPAKADSPSSRAVHHHGSPHATHSGPLTAPRPQCPREDVTENGHN